jgi:hypothetical protein
MGLTQPIIPGLSLYQVAQLNFFHDRIEVPCRGFSPHSRAKMPPVLSLELLASVGRRFMNQIVGPLTSSGGPGCGLFGCGVRRLVRWIPESQLNR